jgi:hypothetical protein
VYITRTKHVCDVPISLSQYPTEYVWDSSDEEEEGDTKKTAYMSDSMDEEDRTDTMNILDQSDSWVIWKSLLITMTT